MTFRLQNKSVYFIPFIAAAALVSCRKDNTVHFENNGYPPALAPIVNHTCANTGCHTTDSKEAAAGLSMSTWAELMSGGNNGNAAVIPFSSQNSPFFFIINHFAELGPTLSPTMPYARPSFTKDRILDFAAWIDAGAPDEFGNIAFEPLNDHELLYVLNAECGLVTILDMASGLVARYVDVAEGGGGFAEILEVSPDQNYFYVCHNSGELKKFAVASNKKVGQLNLGTGFWRTMAISPNSDKALLTDWSGNSDLSGGKIALVNLQTMSLLSMYDNPADSVYFPYGIAVNSDFTVAYASCQTGNFVYKFDLSDELNPTVNRVKLIDTEAYQFFGIPYRPSTITLSPDGQYYFVVCEVANKVYVFQTADDAVIAVLDLGTSPQQVAVSESGDILAVSVMEDITTMPSGKGFVRLFEMTTWTALGDIYSGYQPRALSLNSAGSILYVINRNSDPTGADQPHHLSGCDGNNGYATRIDLGSLMLDANYKAELNVNPISSATKY